MELDIIPNETGSQVETEDQSKPHPDPEVPSKAQLSKPRLSWIAVSENVISLSDSISVISETVNLNKGTTEISRDELKDLITRPNDVFVCSYPKSGSEVIQKLVQQLYRFNQGSASSNPTHIVQLEKVSLEELDKLESHRIMQTNYRYKHLPKLDSFEAKIIYVIRNPKGAAVELYNSGKYYQSIERIMNGDKYGEMLEYIDNVARDDVDDAADVKNRKNNRAGFHRFALSFMDGKDLSEELQYKNHLTEYIENERKYKVLVVKFEDWDVKPLEMIKMIANFLNIRLTRGTFDDLMGIVERVNDTNDSNYVEKDGKVLTNWSFIQKAVAAEDFASFFDVELNRKFGAIFKTNWKMLQSGEC